MAINSLPRVSLITKALLFAFSLMLSANLFAAQNLLPSAFELHSKSKIFGMNVKVSQTLSELDGIYQLSQETSASLIKIKEISTFRFDTQQQLVPMEYHYYRSVFGKKLNRHNFFDGKTTTYQEDKKKSVTVALDHAVSDPLNFIIPIQQWLRSHPALGAEQSFYIAKGKRIREQQYVIQGSACIKTPMGWLKTTIIERLHDDDKKTIIWLADDWEYLVVKMYHEDDDVGKQTIEMEKSSLAGKSIQGASSESDC